MSKPDYFWETVVVLSKKEYKALNLIMDGQYNIQQNLITIKGRKRVACAIKQVVVVGQTKTDYTLNVNGKTIYFLINSNHLV